MGSIAKNGKDRVVLLTGCSSGLGAALALRLYNSNEYRVVATARARSMHILRRMFQESDRFLVRELDVTDDESIASVVAGIFSKWQRIDILINNAGVCYRSVVEHMDEGAELHQLRTNYLGPMALIRAVLPSMRDRGHGHVINISSVSGMLAMPTMGSYSASKAALQSASEALWYESKPFGVNVTVVLPGFIHSSSFQNVYCSRKAQLSQDLEAPYAVYYSALAKFVGRLMNLSRATPERISDRLLRLLGREDPPLWYPVSADAHLFIALRHFLPQRVFHILMFKLLPNPKAWSPKTPIKPAFSQGKSE